MPAPIPVSLYDVVQLRKPHPCGGDQWQVVRLGADIGIVCMTCRRRVLLPRREFERRVKKFIQHAVFSPTSSPEGDLPPAEGGQ